MTNEEINQRVDELQEQRLNELAGVDEVVEIDEEDFDEFAD